MFTPPRRRAWRALCVSCFLVVGVGVSRGSDEPKALFDGKSLSGWTIENGGRFSVREGLLHLDRGTGWLRSDKTYADFTLILEVRFNEARANGGIFVRTGATSHDDENGWPNNGYQVQCMDATDVEHPLGTLIHYGASDFEQVYDAAKIEALKEPAGKWNRLEITCRGEHLAVKLNGTLITLAQGIAKRSGHVGLQGELGPLDFRTIELIEH
ncbi:3-keto-disaccharide hydrolase [Synoicihabitans lomoniglobus]|uniref:DUF1080 domain-containing protein n=1 Tax=Synoicihabitans lomoniglobus TaxID=2909285 RepID=A0AAF0CRP8_9BACT|nr:DUF1080 domain-containing protein [Opitutaceae bacterium LMO-M01]WED66802.1 DUF1080 domain-containing protein [Opitutaceae bacterium LMO-M01]